MFAACLCISSSITRRTQNARKIILNRCFAAVFSVDRHCFRRLNERNDKETKQHERENLQQQQQQQHYSHRSETQH